MSSVASYLKNQKDIAPLVTLRVLFGFMMAFSVVRFAAHGWIYDMYVEPDYYFTYLGFSWVRPLGEIGMYVLYGVMFLASVGVMLGYRYRLSSALFFLSFTYVELIDKTNYLNHYYFVSLIAFLLCIVPAHGALSMDVRTGRIEKLRTVPAWMVDIFKLQVGILYFFAGIAKLNPYWIIEAMPLRMWLPTKSHFPLIGPLLEMPETAYLFSWGGAAYDLFIAFFLLYRPTRFWAYLTVGFFHLMTAALFQIGMFPYIMIFLTTIFFSDPVHHRFHDYLRRLIPIGESSGAVAYRLTSRLMYPILVLFFTIQLLMPFRYLMYEAPLFWAEQGYRFSWRVMLMEKAGAATFRVEDSEGRIEYVSNYDHLTAQQEKMMATQPDMILQYAHHLAAHYTAQGWIEPRVYCDSRVSLNGRRSQPLVDTNVNLAAEPRGWREKKWIMKFDKSK